MCLCVLPSSAGKFRRFSNGNGQSVRCGERKKRKTRRGGRDDRSHGDEEGPPQKHRIRSFPSSHCLQVEGVLDVVDEVPGHVKDDMEGMRKELEQHLEEHVEKLAGQLDEHRRSMHALADATREETTGGLEQVQRRVRWLQHILGSA